MKLNVPAEGLYAVYKTRGLSSYDVLRDIKAQLKEQGITKPKIGHGGTLDPLAEGVLVVAIGRNFTKQLGTLLKGTTKTYEAVICLGATSETDDAEGPIHPTDPVVLREAQERLGNSLPDLSPFEHGYVQTPPRYSALKFQGKPAYARTRSGEQVDMSIKSRHVDISELSILEYAFPVLTVRVVCGSGTYIRSLARDIGEHLGTGAYLSALKRTAVGPFTAEGALQLAVV